MRWIRFSAQGRTAYGFLEGDRITEVAGNPFSGYEATAARHLIGDVKIEVPVIPRTFYCAGLNYTAHQLERARLMATDVIVPKQPDVGYRATNALIAHEEPVVIPKDSIGPVQYEGELVVVIGHKAKHLSEADALSCVLGYTIGNDVSERGWQKSDRTTWRAKNTDTFAPMGPWIETSADVDRMETTVRVNGTATTQFRTGDMLFGVARYIATMTRNLTLYPGDILWMGADGESPDLRPGDVVEIEIAGIGTLRNPFVAEADL